MSSKKRAAILYGVIAILLWCWSGVCFRKGSDIMGSTMVYLTFMTGGGALTALVLQYFRGQSLAGMLLLPARVVIAGFFGVAIYTIMLATAFGVAPVSEIGQINLLNYLWPVWMVVLGIVLLGSKPKKACALVGILIGLVGVVISRGFDVFSHPPASIFPHTMALVAGFLWALYVILLRKWNIPEEKGGTALHFTVCALVAGSIAAYLQEWGTVPPVSGEMVFWIVFGGMGPVGIAYSLYEISVKNGPVLLIASISYFIPIGSSILIGLFFNETMNKGLFIGAILIALGAWLVRYASNESKPMEG